MPYTRKKVTFRDSVFIVEKTSALDYCGLVEGITPCPFYSVIFKGLQIRPWPKQNKAMDIKNMERHNCLLSDLKYGTETGAKLWRLCPGEPVI